jgi:hypothetical protein
MVGDDVGGVRDIEQIQGPAMDWARQTIAFAPALREEEIGQPLNNTQIAELASGEAKPPLRNFGVRPFKSVDCSSSQGASQRCLQGKCSIGLQSIGSH